MITSPSIISSASRSMESSFTRVPHDEDIPIIIILEITGLIELVIINLVSEWT